MERKDTKPRVSFLIRTYNEAKFLGRLLEVIASQKGSEGPPEIIVVDSGSTDSTVEIARSHKVHLIQTKKEDFNYSTALNIGMEASSAELSVILSAHAIPCSNDWLAKMISHFESWRVVGVYCRELPWPDADWREVRRLSRAFGDQSLVFDQDTPPEQITFSNAASCIRRTAWQEHPFVVLPYSEDYEWAGWALASGYRIVYEAGACVYHSHNESCRQAAHRLINVEKAIDVRASRSRGFFLTFSQAARWTGRDLGDVWRLRASESERVRLAWDCLVRNYWYVRDFNRP